MKVSKATYPKGTLERVPGKSNWVDRVGGLPRMIERIAAHLHYEKGKSIGHSIAIAVNAVKKGCATGDLNYPGKQSMNVKSRAAYCKAVAQWESKKARARVNKGIHGRKLSDREYVHMLTGELVDKRFFSADRRRQLARQGKALPDGSFPIETREDVKNALKLVGHGKASKKKIKSHIKRNAKRIGAEDMLTKSEEDFALETIGLTKHASHRQKSHGNWARGSSAISVGEVIDVPGLGTGSFDRRYDVIRISGDTAKVRMTEGKLKNGKMRKFSQTTKNMKVSRLQELKSGKVDKRDEFSVLGDISKVEDDKQLVFGWASVAIRKNGEVVVDKQGDVLEDIDAMEKVAYDFVLHSRDGGEMHVRKGVSTLVESFVSTPEKNAALGIPEGTLPTGWWVGFKVHDPDVFKGVKDGKYKMFSVHGRGTRKALAAA